MCVRARTMAARRPHTRTSCPSHRAAPWHTAGRLRSSRRRRRRGRCRRRRRLPLRHGPMARSVWSMLAPAAGWASPCPVVKAASRSTTMVGGARCRTMAGISMTRTSCAVSSATLAPLPSRAAPNMAKALARSGWMRWHAPGLRTPWPTAFSLAGMQTIPTTRTRRTWVSPAPTCPPSHRPRRRRARRRRRRSRIPRQRHRRIRPGDFRTTSATPGARKRLAASRP